jgi:hypothetical protein
MRTEDHLGKERRKYIRLDTVFPVQFRLMPLDGKSFISDWLLGFTSDVGHGGICLSVNALDPQLAKLIREQQVKISLEIEMPLLKSPAVARAKIAWVKDFPGNPTRYLLGLTYEDIDPSQKAMIMRYAWTRKLFIPVLVTVILILGLGVAVNTYTNFRLVKNNRALIEQLVQVSQEAGLAKERAGQITKEREGLEGKIRSLQSRIQSAEEEKAALEKGLKTESEQKLGELNALVGKLSKDKVSLEGQLVSLQRQESAISEELQRLDKTKGHLEKANFDKMYRWLTVHQNPHTGLVMSFEGDSDIKNWAFTYDQSLVIQVYNNFSDFGRVRKILDFFAHSAERSGGLYLNAYYASDGGPAEYSLHCGPNTWLGIAILHYTKESQDSTYLYLAEEIAQAIMALQDAEGGVRGGPDTRWYATEHNLDAYAFFNMLYKMTGKQQYLTAGNKVLQWLQQHTYSQQDIPIKRGKGDSTIATDTYAWSIAAIGPAKLEEIGMNPENILEFAEKNCAVEVAYTRLQGRTVNIKGFDFAPQINVSRGAVVSSEWTAQMVMAFKILGDYYEKKGEKNKALAYKMKADGYLDELGKMIISSPSPSGQGEGCLPYATQDDVDTGHGWRTPKGNSTGSIAGTAYTIFAYYNYNPLDLKN